MNNYQIDLAKRLISKAKDLKRNIHHDNIVTAKSNLKSCADSVEKLDIELEKNQKIKGT